MKLVISAKCSDCCYSALYNDEDERVAEIDGYAPSFRGIGGGDYIEIEVDLKTGKLIGFTPMTDEEAKEAMNA